MGTSQGWLRAKLRLDGIDVKYGSLKEAYLLTALAKDQRVEAKRVTALATAAAGAKAENIREAVNAFLEELFPSLGESRETFAEMGKKILEKEAGRVIDFSRYKEDGFLNMNNDG